MEIHTFKSFLESARYRLRNRNIEISDEFKTKTKGDIENIIRKYAPYALEGIKKGTHTPIYRGFDSDSPDIIYIEDPSRHKRASANTFNYYTVLIDNSPYWEEYPKRSESIICTTNINKADNYGELYVVIPLDPDAKFGVCPERDIWLSFEKLNKSINILIEIWEESNLYLKNKNAISTLGEFNILLNDVFGLPYSLDYDELVEYITIDRLKTRLINRKNIDIDDDEYIGRLEKELKDIDIDEYIGRLEKELKGDTLIEWLNKQMDPIKNDFELLNLSELKGKEDNEVWIDSPCLMIRYKTYRKLFEINNEN